MRGRLATTTGYRSPSPSRSVTPATLRSPPGEHGWVWEVLPLLPLGEDRDEERRPLALGQGGRRGVLRPLPLGEGWGEGGGRRGPRDPAKARPPSYAKVSTGETERAGVGVLPSLPLGEGWGEGGGRRGPRDLAKARPPSHTKVSTGRGLAAIPPTFDGRAQRGVLRPLPLGEGWGEGGGRRGPRDLAKARPPSHTKVSSGRGLAAIPPTFDGRARRGVLLPLPLGEGWGAGGGRRGPRDLAKARPPSHTKVSTGRGLR